MPVLSWEPCRRQINEKKTNGCLLTGRHKGDTRGKWVTLRGGLEPRLKPFFSPRHKGRRSGEASYGEATRRSTADASRVRVQVQVGASLSTRVSSDLVPCSFWDGVGGTLMMTGSSFVNVPCKRVASSVFRISTKPSVP